MSGHLDLGAFLNEQTAEGDLDSHGQFTVSHSQAARKLAKFALPRSTAWASKLVQAANRWNCSAIQIRQSNAETLFHFTFPKLGDLPTEDAIVSALLSGKVGGTEPLDALSLALRSLVEQAKLSFILVVDDGDLKPRPVYAGQYYGELSEQARLNPRFHPKPGLSLTVYHRPPATGEAITDVMARFRGFVPIIEELDTYAHTSRVPIVLDGRRIDGIVSSSGSRPSQAYRPLAFQGVQRLEHSPDVFPAPEDFEEKVLSLLTHQRRVARSYGGARDFQGLFSLMLLVEQGFKEMLGERRFSRMLWVADGVVVLEEQFNLKPESVSLTIYANAQGLDTDLTGLTPLHNQAFVDRRLELKRAVGKKIKEPKLMEADYFRNDKDALSRTDDEHDDQQAVRDRIKVLLKGSGTGLTLTLFNPVLGVPTTLAALIGTYARKPTPYGEKVLSQRDKLRRSLERDLTELVRFLGESS